MKVPAFLLAFLVFSLRAEAHRLDEYLQATRLAVAINHVDIEADLTPGVAVFAELLPLFDTDADGRVSPEEARRYARRVLTDLEVQLDGKRLVLALQQVRFPAREDMAAGEGVIHLNAIAKTSTLEPGRHELRLANHHLPRIGVYLVNALVPSDQTIQITGQIRDKTQTNYRLEFTVGAKAIGRQAGSD